MVYFMNISKYELQFVHENKPYQLTLYDSDINVTAAEADKPKIHVKGRNYAIVDDPSLPRSITDLFDSFRGKTFASDQALLKKIELSSEKIEGLSLTKKVFDIATEHLLKEKYLASESAIQFRDKAFANLKSCDPTDTETIEKIVKNSKCSSSVLFAIAAQIENDQLADEIREIARPFNLKAELQGICEQVKANHFNKEQGKKYAGYIENKFQEGAYKKIYDAQDLAILITADLIEISHDPHFEVDVKMHGSSRITSAEENQKNELARLQSTNFGFGEVLELFEPQAREQQNLM